MAAISELAVRVSADIKEFEKGMSGMQQKLGTTMKTAGTAFVAVGVASAAAIGLMVKSAADFDGAMRNVNTMTRLTEKEFQALSKEVVNLSRHIPESATSLAKGLYSIVSAGVPAAQQMIVLEIAAKAAAAGLSTTEAAVLGITGVIKAYGDGFDKASEISDLFFKTVELGQTTFDEMAISIGKVAPIAATAKISQEELMAAYATLTGVTGNTAEVTTQLRSAISAIIKPSSEAIEVAQRLGLNFSAASLQAKGLEGFLQYLGKATRGNVEDTAKLFGSTEALNAVLALTGTQADIFTEKLAQMRDSGGATQAAFEEQAKSFNHQWQLMKNNLEALKISIGTALLPTIGKLVEFFTKTIGMFVDAHPVLSKIVAVTLLLGAALGLTLGPIFLLLAALPSMIAGYKTLIAVKILLTSWLGKTAIAQWAVNLAMAANPIVAIIIAVLGLTAVLGGLCFAFKKVEDAHKAALSNIAEDLQETIVTGDQVDISKISKGAISKISKGAIGSSEASILQSYHEGVHEITRLGPREVPLIAEEGEIIVSKNDQKKMSSGTTNHYYTVHMNVQADEIKNLQDLISLFEGLQQGARAGLGVA